MKLIVDIPEDTYLLCKSLPMDDIQKAIAQGTPYEDRPHGKWIYTSMSFFECSECSYSVDSDNTTPFCPNCGADMRKGGAE